MVYTPPSITSKPALEFHFESDERYNRLLSSKVLGYFRDSRTDYKSFLSLNGDSRVVKNHIFKVGKDVHMMFEEGVLVPFLDSFYFKQRFLPLSVRISSTDKGFLDNLLEEFSDKSRFHP